MEQLATAKEEAIRCKTELKVERHEKEMALSDMSEIKHALKLAGESVDVVNDTCHQLKEERIELLQKIQRLEEQVHPSTTTV